MDIMQNVVVFLSDASAKIFNLIIKEFTIFVLKFSQKRYIMVSIRGCL